MTPASANRAVQTLLNGIAELRGVRVYGQYDAAPTAGDETAWVRYSVEHQPEAVVPSDFGSEDIYQRVSVRVDANSATSNPERAWHLAESIRAGIVGVETDDGLTLETGIFDSTAVVGTDWATMTVRVSGEYLQDE